MRLKELIMCAVRRAWDIPSLREPTNPGRGSTLQIAPAVCSLADGWTERGTCTQ
jgi:hypothetical protein